MTDASIADQARALADDERFCEWLDATGDLNEWPHNRYSARRWLEYQCGVDSLGHIGRDPEAAAAFGQIAEQFALWDSNGEPGA